MRRCSWSAVAWTTVIVGCAAGGAVATNVRAPLGAHLTAGAQTGAPIPLRFDSTAHVIRSTAANLPPATYWPTQAEYGERVFNQTCAMCHARSQFVGESFVETWKDRRVFDFYALIRSTMPLTNPGASRKTRTLPSFHICSRPTTPKQVRTRCDPTRSLCEAGRSPFAFRNLSS